MKRVKSLKDLTRLALATGGSAVVDGGNINASGAVVKLAAVPRPVPEPPEAPQEPSLTPEQDAMMRMAQAVEKIVERIDKERQVETQAPEIEAEPYRARAWSMNVVKDEGGKISLDIRVIDGAGLDPGMRPSGWESKIEQEGEFITSVKLFPFA